MSPVVPRMTELFLQLGLEAGATEIADFIKTHQLPAGLRIHDAEIWTDAQRQFLGEQLKEDAEWAIVVDQLNEALHENAVKQQTGLN